MNDINEYTCTFQTNESKIDTPISIQKKPIRTRKFSDYLINTKIYPIDFSIKQDCEIKKESKTPFSIKNNKVIKKPIVLSNIATSQMKSQNKLVEIKNNQDLLIKNKRNKCNSMSITQASSYKQSTIKPLDKNLRKDSYLGITFSKKKNSL